MKLLTKKKNNKYGYINVKKKRKKKINPALFKKKSRYPTSYLPRDEKKKANINTNGNMRSKYLLNARGIINCILIFNNLFKYCQQRDNDQLPSFALFCKRGINSFNKKPK